jgi:hypothetical protein
MPNATHPIWPIIQVLTRQAILLFALWIFYNGLDPRDVKTMLLAIFADAGLTAWGVATNKSE